MVASLQQQSTHRALVVEDNEHMAYMLRFILERAGYEVHVACNGRDAEAAIENLEPVDIILLDNMSPPMLREAVELIDGRALVEASGGIVLANLEEVAKTGVDIISIGALTHSAPACDIGMDWA